MCHTCRPLDGTPCAAQEFATLADNILAYSFRYPVTLQGRRLPLIPSRKPERYSSAAPLTADARQRIVAELVSFPDTLTISVAVRRAVHSSVEAHFMTCMHACNHAGRRQPFGC